MREIELTQGQKAIVDDADFEWLSQWKWCAHEQGKKRSYYYAVREENHKLVSMHRKILGLKKGEFGDHINGNTLDNRRCNLRKCSHSENMQNCRLRRGRKFRGIRRYGVSWAALIKVNGKMISLGGFNSEEEAAAAYNALVEYYHEQFRRLNTVELSSAIIADIKKKVERRFRPTRKGVSLHRPSGLWRAYIHENGKCISLGYYRSAREAALAYNTAALKYRGDNAVLNILC